MPREPHISSIHTETLNCRDEALWRQQRQEGRGVSSVTSKGMGKKNGANGAT